jgi:hypothetical protein
MSDSNFTSLFPADLIKARLQSVKSAVAPRRTTHGSTAWTTPSRYTDFLAQPQDGALTNPAADSSERTSRVHSISASARESKDAHLTGSMRSLARRVLGLNVTAPRKTAPVSVPPTDSNLLDSVRKQVARKVPSVEATRLSHPQVA